MKIKIFLLMTLLACGCSIVNSQTRDPFAKPSWARPKTTSGVGSGTKSGPVPVAPPSIQERIEYYKKLREMAIQNDGPIPKVTSVLTLDELTVTGIFKTPRGYAAMVEATPIKLSYTIYPGDKFFDGQLVAVEENKLIFRKVTKLSNGKFIVSEETKPLRQYTIEQELSGTVPTETSTKSTETTETSIETTKDEQTSRGFIVEQKKEPKSIPERIVSPLEEMIQAKPENSGNTDKKSETKSIKTKKKQ